MALRKLSTFTGQLEILCLSAVSACLKLVVLQKWPSASEDLILFSHSRTDVSGTSATERDNPIYESQELTIEMFQDTAASSDEEKEERKYESQVSCLRNACH